MLSYQINMPSTEVEYLFFPMPVTNALMAAEKTGVNLSDVAKTLIIKVQADFFAAVIILGSQQIDRKKLTRVMNISKFRFATPEETLDYSGYGPGAVCPLKFKNISRVFADLSVFTKEKIIVGGGTLESLARISPNQLLKIHQSLTVSNLSRS